MINCKFQYIFYYLLGFLFTGCAVLPNTLNENNLIVIANYKWIGKIGKTTLSESAAKPVLRNFNTGEKYYPKYKDKSFTYFYNLGEGKYIVDEIILDAGRVQLHMKMKDKANPFEIGKSGAFYIGGIDIVDYQTRFEFKLHDSTQVHHDLETASNLLYTKTSFPLSSKIEVIENVLNREKWETNEKK
jgi:hypothetical protein